MDFTVEKEIGRDIKADFEALRIGKGYDHCWVIDGYRPGEMALAAVLCDKRSGRVLEISTDRLFIGRGRQFELKLVVLGPLIGSACRELAGETGLAVGRHIFKHKIACG